MGQLEQKLVGVSTKKCQKVNHIQWVKITTRYWEWHGELVMTKSRKHTENQLSNIILTKIRHLEQRRSLKRLERLMMFCQTPKRSKSMISMVRRDSKEAWEEAHLVLEECQTSAMVRVTATHITEIPGPHSHNFLEAAIHLLPSSLPAPEEWAGDSEAQRAWILT